MSHITHRHFATRVAILVSTFATVSSCGDFSTGCDADLQIRMTPESHTLRVGQSFQPNVVAYGCGGTKALTWSWNWSSADTTIMRVHPQSGMATAVGVGSTRLIATPRDFGGGAGDVDVTVTQ